MTTLRQLGVLLLLLVSCVAPSMACAEPAAQMSAQERECCLKTPEMCGQMNMDQQHGCCEKVPAGVKQNALDSKAVTAPVVAVLVLQRLTAWEMPSTADEANALAAHAEAIVPESPPPPISSLRI